MKKQANAIYHLIPYFDYLRCDEGTEEILHSNIKEERNIKRHFLENKSKNEEKQNTGSTTISK